MIPKGFKIVEYATNGNEAAELLRAFGESIGAVDCYIGRGYVAYVVPA